MAAAAAAAAAAVVAPAMAPAVGTAPVDAATVVFAADSARAAAIAVAPKGGYGRRREI